MKHDNLYYCIGSNQSTLQYNNLHLKLIIDRLPRYLELDVKKKRLPQFYLRKYDEK